MKTLNVALALVGIALLVGACSRATISPNWGAAYQNMRANQVLNPTAGEQLDPVEGQAGNVNTTAMEAYRKGFEKPEADFSRSTVTSGVQTK
jgi:hypothetical protein